MLTVPQDPILTVLGKRTLRRPKPPSARDRLRASLNAPVAEAAPSSEVTVEHAAPPHPLHTQDSIGTALRVAREAAGLSLPDIALTTRVRRAYLEAVEEMRLDALPSRPFTIGYIRAYADALGLDPDIAVERFKSDEPVLDEPLRAPVGVPEDRDPRVAALTVAALIALAAIVMWNIAQRAMMAEAPPAALAAPGEAERLLAGLKTGPVTLGEPLPAPVESTTPPVYETPGLAAAMGLKSNPEASVEAPSPRPVGEAPPVDLAALQPVFQRQGRIYGATDPRLNTPVTLQALRGAALIVRGPDGSIYFARQLMKGEAYRVPRLAGLTLDVSAPQDFQVFIGGRSAGVLPAQQVLASILVAAPPPAPRPPT
ncbi:helix-turn-helix domain-containing protein [Phenylobacterium sp.]|jgi:transcriptional regulator with XRE-family HTH domain|uniref:helix-turn-helix domain-containing protein n=1 Tax=Phenylobacterium sp. TaxID=1871053 RepID=UPI0037C8E83A